MSCLPGSGEAGRRRRSAPEKRLRTQQVLWAQIAAGWGKLTRVVIVFPACPFPRIGGSGASTVQRIGRS